MSGNVELLRRALEAINARDLDTLIALSDPEIEFTTRPANVAKYAEFMHAIGSIEHAPESWRDLFFPEIHGAAGS